MAMCAGPMSAVIDMMEQFTVVSKIKIRNIFKQ
jgi:hypothetical protein